MNDRNRPLYMIGVAAELAGVHPQTLRIYEQKGLVNPQRTRGNTRMYSQADIERLHERDDEIDDLHKRVRRLADRVHELETFEHVSSLVAQSTSLELRRIR